MCHKYISMPFLCRNLVFYSKPITFIWQLPLQRCDNTRYWCKYNWKLNYFEFQLYVHSQEMEYIIFYEPPVMKYQHYVLIYLAFMIICIYIYIYIYIYVSQYSCATGNVLHNMYKKMLLCTFVTALSLLWSAHFHEMKTEHMESFSGHWKATARRTTNGERRGEHWIAYLEYGTF